MPLVLLLFGFLNWDLNLSQPQTQYVGETGFGVLGF